MDWFIDGHPESTAARTYMYPLSVKLLESAIKELKIESRIREYIPSRTMIRAWIMQTVKLRDGPDKDAIGITGG